MTDERLAELKKLCAEAPSWRSFYYGEHGADVLLDAPDGDVVAIIHAQKPNTTAFIVAARAALPELIAEIERQTAEIKHWKAAYEEAKGTLRLAVDVMGKPR